MKVALLIAGEIRTNKIPFYNFIKKNNIDCFISTWSNIGKRHTDIKNNSSIKFKFMNNKTGLNAINLINSIPNLKSRNIEDIIAYDNIDSIDESFLENSYSKFSPIGTIYNIYHINKALNLLKKHEIDNKIKYDMIIKVRPDLYFRNFINKKFLDEIYLDKIIFSKNTSNYFQKSDKLFLAKRDLFIKFIDAINKYKNFVFSQKIDYLKVNYSSNIGGDINFMPPIGEKFFHQVIMKYNFNFSIMNDKETFIMRDYSLLNFAKKIYNCTKFY